MSNERYLIVSYFVVAVVCVGLGILVYYILRKPFSTVADAIVGENRSVFLKRALMFTMAAASTLGFLAFSYNQKGCVSYEFVVKNRYFLETARAEQLQGARDWISWTLLGWGVVVGIGLAARRRNKPGS